MTVRRRQMLCALGSALAVDGCGAHPPPAGPSATAPSPVSKDAPAELGPAPQNVVACVEPLIASGWARGAVVGVVEIGAGAPRYRVSGLGDEEAGGAAIGADTVFEIGSVTKTFTAAVFAQLVADGVVALDARLVDVLPGVALHDLAKPMTLLHLATHRSGLPRMQARERPKDPADPHKADTETDILKWLARWKPEAAPGEKDDYSNVGYTLLGMALSAAARMPYEELVAKHVTKPLSLKDTLIALDAARLARFAEPHDADGAVVPKWTFAASAPAGALRSTARDMLVYVAAHLSPPPAWKKLVPAILEPRFDKDDRNSRALSWKVATDGSLASHNGGTGGTRSYVALDATRKLGIVVLMNTECAYFDQAAFRAVRALQGTETKPLALPVEIILEPASLARFAGRFERPGGLALKMEPLDERIRVTFMKANGANEQHWFYPSSPTAAFARSFAGRIELALDERGEVKAISFTKDDRSIELSLAKSP